MAPYCAHPGHITRPWESDVPKVTAVRRQVFKIFFVAATQRMGQRFAYFFTTKRSVVWSVCALYSSMK